MARKRANLTDLLNELTFRKLFDKAKLMATTAHEWEGLPEGILERHIENFLFDHGKAVFYRKKGMSFMCLEAQDGHGLNPYGDPLGYWANGFGVHDYLDAEECVIVENNPLRLNTRDFVMFYVNKLTEAERTMDVNVKRAKTPYILRCDDKDELSIKRIFAQIDGNEPAIFPSRKLNIESADVLLTPSQFIGNELMDYKKSVENDLLTFLGYNNVPVDKKERVNVHETDSNNQLIESFAELQLRSRRKACEAINQMYGLNISVKRREGGLASDVAQRPLDVQSAEADSRAS